MDSYGIIYRISAYPVVALVHVFPLSNGEHPTVPVTNLNVYEFISNKFKYMSKQFRNLKVHFWDDWRSGSHLNEYNGNQKSNYYDIYDLNLPTKSQIYFVCHLCLELGNGCNLTKLRSFEKYDDAVLYAKQQYKLALDTNPFIISGVGGGFKNEGDRLEIKMDPNLECELPKPDKWMGYGDNDLGINFLVIANDQHFETHHLSQSAEW